MAIVRDRSRSLRGCVDSDARPGTGSRSQLQPGLLRAAGRRLAGLGPWDIAAAALIVEEAGGRVSDLDGGPFVLRTGRLLASNGRVHDEMVATIASYAAERARKRTL